MYDLFYFIFLAYHVACVVSLLGTESMLLPVKVRSPNHGPSLNCQGISNIWLILNEIL